MEERVFSDTPIVPRTGSSVDDHGRIALFRRYLGKLESEPGSSEEMFVKAALVMADYESDGIGSEPCLQYASSYQMLTDRQLIGYFAWRTAFRKGSAGSPSNYTYMLLFVNEVINGVGWSEPPRGLELLESAIGSVGDRDPLSYPYIAWVHDFIAAYGPDDAEIPMDRELRIFSMLSDPRSADADDLIDLFELSSSYPLHKKKVFVRFRSESVGIIRELLLGYENHLRQEGIDGLRNAFFRLQTYTHYHMFPTALHLSVIDAPDVTRTVGGVLDYERRRGVWTKTIPWPISERRTEFGTLLRALDVRLRRLFGSGPVLSPSDDESSWMADLAEYAISAWEDESRRQRIKEFVIDTSQLDRIRMDSDEIRDRIMTSEEMPDEEPVSMSSPPPSSREGCPLNADESSFLSILLDGGDWKGFLQDRGISWMVLTDSINSKLYNEFCDNVIEMTPDGPVPVDDYVNDLVGMLGL